MKLHHVPGSRMEIVVADLDSTIADTRPRRHLCPTVDAGRTWSEYAMACSRDKPLRGTVQLLRIFNAAGYGIHIVTQRPECARALTEIWLKDQHVPFDVLVMRPDAADMDETFKATYIDTVRTRGYEPVLAIEDWPSTAKLIEATGVPVICINPRYGDE